MNRREFLAAGAVFAGTSLPPFGASAAVPSAERPIARAWAPESRRFAISFDGDNVALDWLSNDEPAASFAGSPAVPLAAVGPRRQAVQWDLGAWEQPTAFEQRLALQARGHPLHADIVFGYDPLSGFVTRRTRLLNVGADRGLELVATLGFVFRIHERLRRLFYLAGGWEQEADLQRMRPGADSLVLESRAGKTGFEFQPYVALRTGAAAYVCQIFWSGNWALEVQPQNGGAILSGGLNNWEFRHTLHPGDSLVLPEVLFGRFTGPLDLAARRLHDFRRARRPDPNRPIPVQFNSWYPYPGEPTAESLGPLIPIAKRLGCETFVLDAGWYRTDHGDSDASWEDRTGDWRVSRNRFPDGLREFSARCRREGLQFGLWFEPEVVAPLSSIRRDHPDWLHHAGGRPPPADERAVLNLGVPAAWQHVYARIARLLRVAQVDWMKWDFNADIEPGGWAPSLPPILTGRAPLVAHYEGLYRLQDAIRAAFPNLTLEMCASGGGRLDAKIMSHAHVNWMSDQVGALRKLAMHFGTQLAHPAVTCNDWLVDWPGEDADEIELFDPRGDLALRLRVAMLGSFGISAAVDNWSEADIGLVAAHVALYKSRLRAIIHHGDQYYLTRPPPPDGNGDWAAVWYAAKDASAGALFAFRLAGRDERRVFRLAGLQDDRAYRVTPFSGHSVVATGASLAAGFAVVLADPFRSELCLVEALPERQASP